MSHTLPKITRLYKPSVPDLFGLTNSPIGYFLLAWQNDALVRVALLPAHAENDIAPYLADYGLGENIKRNDSRAKDVIKTDLFPDNQWHGTPSTQLKLGFYGTDTQYNILSQMLKIPKGKTLTYGALAEKAKSPGAARVAGSVCAKNPLPFLIPCHRITASTGLGDYMYGTALKRQLLDWEKTISA